MPLSVEVSVTGSAGDSVKKKESVLHISPQKFLLNFDIARLQWPRARSFQQQHIVCRRRPSNDRNICDV